MHKWTCKKCKGKFTPRSGSRICDGCRTVQCIECSVSLAGLRADTVRCINCKPAYAVARAKKWYSENKRRRRKYDEDRRIEKRQLYRAASQRNRIRHPGRKNADTAARRANLVLRTPSWANLNAIKEVYENCPKGYHVDHIVPLRGKTVSGFHVETNLQYLPKTENMRKHNHYSLEHNGVR